MSSFRDRVVWDQLRSRTAKDFIRARERDGWEEEGKRGAARAFRKSDRRVVIRYHPKKTYGPRLLEELFRQTGWTEDDLRRLKLVKGKRGRR